MHKARILADSISPAGYRLTTMEVTLPRIILAEFNTHRVFSRNSASSRAIPVEKMLRSISENPYIPSHWGKNQKGMVADVEIAVNEQDIARQVWLDALSSAMTAAQKLVDLGVHKQVTNRLLEPFMWQTIIVSATEWDNYFNLRCHPDAHPEIKRAAELMRQALDASEPKCVTLGNWHLPLVFEEDYELVGQFLPVDCRKSDEEVIEVLKKVSAGRCARVSYLTHDGKRDLAADVKLADRLISSGHMSPIEHVATPMSKQELREVYLNEFAGNFRGWVQMRKQIPYENNMLGARSE